MADFVIKQIEPRRMFGFFPALAFSVAGISLAYSGLLPLVSLIGMWPSEQLPGILTVGMLLCLLLTYTYAAIGSAAPYAGADYVLASRVLGGGVAFVASWTFVVFSGLLCGFFIVSIIREFIPFSLETLAILGKIPGIANTADSTSNPDCPGDAWNGAIAWPLPPFIGSSTYIELDTAHWRGLRHIGLGSDVIPTGISFGRFSSFLGWFHGREPL